METPLRIVLVEDHALVRSATRAILDQSPEVQVVAEADEADHALRLIEALKPDVVITDIRLKGSNGVDLTAAIKARYPSIRTLVLTAYPYEQYLRAMVRAGAGGYLLKHASAEELMTAIRDVSEGHFAISPEVRERMAELGPDLDRYGPSRDLTPREIEVLELLQVPLSVPEVADRLKLSRKTVYTHLSHIQSKLRERTASGALQRAQELRLLDRRDGPPGDGE